MLKKRKQQLFIESVASGLACLVILIVLLYFAFFMISKPALMNSQESQTETKLPPTQSNKIIVKIPSAPTTPAPNCCYFCKTSIKEIIGAIHLCPDADGDGWGEIICNECVIKNENIKR